MTQSSELPVPAQARLDQWLAAHDEEAPGCIEGLYVVGSLALGDWRPGSDVDVVAVLAEPPDDELAERLRRAHDRDTADAPEPTVDGPYVAWGDLSVPPQPLHRPWSSHGEFHHDAECREINPVTWHVLATSAIAVRGPDPAALGVHDDEALLLSWVRADVDDRWFPVLQEFDGAVDEVEPGGSFPGGVAAWCVLGACRALVTVDTGQVVGATRAGELVAEVLPDHADPILRCVGLRTAPADLTPAATRACVEAMAAVLAAVRDR